MKVGIIGAGRMGEALATGFIKSKALSPKQLILSDPDNGKLIGLKKRLGIEITKDNLTVAESDLVILAVKPAYVALVAHEIRPKAANKLIVSIAAGIRLKRVESILTLSRVIRVMPNTPCLVCEGAIAYSLGSRCREKDEKTFATLFSNIGECLKVSEKHMDSVTGLTGSGPAYVYLIADALMEAGRKEGLNGKLASRLVLQLLTGATKMMVETKKAPQELIDMVTSPNGTTIQGLKVLQRRRVKNAFVSAIAAAAKRGRELAAENQ